MDLKDIVTKNKEQFLEAEIKWFHFRSMKKFKSVMEEDVRACKNCGVLYWEGCLKRCKCE